MPRNEFMNHADDDETDVVFVKDGDGNVVNKYTLAIPEEQSLEVDDIVVDPQPSLAALRKVPGGSTTKAHIAEIYGSEDVPLI